MLESDMGIEIKQVSGYEELERWEQPTAKETLDYTPEAVATAAAAALAAADPSAVPRPDHLFVAWLNDSVSYYH